MTTAVEATASSWPDLLWTSAELEQRGTWRRELPPAVRDELLAFVDRGAATAAVDFVWRPEQWPELVAFGRAARRDLLTGDGVLCVRGLGALGLDEEAMRCFYTAMGHALGTPMLQYGRLYPVVDRGASYKTSAVPVSMTNAETAFHTDSSSVDVEPDFVGLLCETPSDHGGDSLVSNALRVYRTMQQESPELLARLEQPLIRDVVTPGLEKNRENLLRNRFPVFAPSDRAGGVLFRYMRYWIEKGQEKADQPLDDEALRALDRLDELLAAPENVVTFRLERGDILWVNNRLLAHNRTGYQDTPDNVRQLQRMWIQAPEVPADR